MTQTATASCPFSGASAETSPTGCPVSHHAAAFDAFEGPYQIDPAEALRWAQESEPVFYSPKLGYWVVTRYQDVKDIFRDNILFSPSIVLEKITPAPPEAQTILAQYGYAMDRTMVNEDEPAHMQRRRLLIESFAPDELKKQEADIRRLTREYMDRFIDKGRADLVDDIFREIPLTVALHFLGVPQDGIDELRQFSVAHTVNTWGRPTREEQLGVADTVGRFWQAANRILDEMMRDPSGTGWMHFSIRQHHKHPDVVTESYLRSMMMAILVAAHETTSYAATNAFRLLLSDRNAWNELCENPGLIPNAVEECLRRAGSIVAWRRLVTADTKVGGVDIPKGSKLLIVMASANHDERQFENPFSLDLHRGNAIDHLSFGYGSHQCMGKNIARMEIRIFLEEFIKRLPHMRMEPQTFEFLPNTSFRGPKHLWVTWDPKENPERRDPALLGRHQDFKIGAPSKREIARPLRVKQIHRETDQVVRLVLEDPHGRDLPNWTAGSHIDVVVDGLDRQYSLCGDPASPTYEIAVLREESGRGGSKFIHDQVKEGMILRTRGPSNRFRLDETAEGAVLIAAGIGITPIIAMADRLKALGKPYELHYAGRSPDEMALSERVLRDHGARLHQYCKSQGRRLDLAAVMNALAPGWQVYACGPERLLSEIETLAEGWPDGRLHVEHFSGSGLLLDPSKEISFEVELRDSGRTLQVAPDQTLLRALHAAGVDVACDCEEGLCGSCEVGVIEGDVDHRDMVLTRVERSENRRMMACCSRARQGKLTLSL